MTALVVFLALTGADCAGCHPREAAVFKASRHANASQLAIFAVSARVANTRWCATCHRPADGPGLDCLSCHGGDAVRSSRTGDAPHPIVVEPGFGSASCARCHEFATPLPDHLDPVVYSSQPLQSTVSELRGPTSGDPAPRCTGCHDPHGARGGHDPATVRAALRFASATTPDGVELRVTAAGVGHRFPTGDPFRRLVVTACEDPACERVVGRQVIGRGFGLVDGVWAPVVDHTLRDGETRVLRFAPAGWWRAELFYGDPRFEAKLAPCDVSIELGRGRVAPR